MKKNFNFNKPKNYKLNFGPQFQVAWSKFWQLLELIWKLVVKTVPHTGLSYRGTEIVNRPKKYNLNVVAVFSLVQEPLDGLNTIPGHIATIPILACLSVLIIVKLVEKVLEKPKCPQNFCKNTKKVGPSALFLQKTLVWTMKQNTTEKLFIIVKVPFIRESRVLYKEDKSVWYYDNSAFCSIKELENNYKINFNPSMSLNTERYTQRFIKNKTPIRFNETTTFLAPGTCFDCEFKLYTEILKKHGIFAEKKAIPKATRIQKVLFWLRDKKTRLITWYKTTVFRVKTYCEPPRISEPEFTSFIRKSFYSPPPPIKISIFRRFCIMLKSFLFF